MAISPAQAPDRWAARQRRQCKTVAWLCAGIEPQPHLARHGREQLNLLEQLGVVFKQSLLPLQDWLQALFKFALKDLGNVFEQGFQLSDLKPRFGQLPFGGR